MYKNLRIGVVGAIILALIAPASPASNALGDARGEFSAQNASLSLRVVDGLTNQQIEAYVYVDKFVNQHNTQPVESFFPDNPGVVQPYQVANLEDGDYLVVAEKFGGDSFSLVSYFNLKITSGSISAFHVEGQPNASVNLVDDAYQLPVFQANFYVKVLNPDGSAFLQTQDQRVDGELQRQDGSQWVRDEWLSPYNILDQNDSVIESGIKGRALDPSKTYRVKLRPVGVAGAAETFSPSFTISSLNQAPQRLSDLRLDTPGLQINVVAPGSTTPISNSFTRLFNDDCCLDFYNGNTGLPIAIVFEQAGTFEIEVSTDNPDFSDLAAARYTVVVSEVAGKLVGVVSGQTAVNGVYNLELRAANLILKIIDPRDNQVIDNAEARISELVGGVRGDYVVSGWSQNLAALSFSLEDGSYLLEVRPENGDYLLSSTSYLLTVSNSGSTVVITTNSATPQAVAATDGIFLLRAALSNLIGSVVDVNDTALVTNWSQRKWVSVNLYRYIVIDERWEWFDNTNVDSGGRFSFNVSEAGDYRVEIQPQGYPDSANLTFDFELSANDLLETTTLAHPIADGNVKIVLPLPDLRVVVRAPGGTVNLGSADIQIFRNGNFVTHANTASSGIAAISLPEAGVYELRVSPPRSAIGTGRSIYRAVLSVEGNVRSAVITEPTLVEGVYPPITSVEGIHVLELGVPALSGEVTSPEGSPMRDIEVVPVDRVTGWDLWEYSTRSNAFGQYSLVLPEGEFDIYARAPWGDVSVGDSDRLGPVIVNSAGVATSIPTGPPGFAADAFDLKLNLPTWTGTLVSPTNSSQILNRGNVCLLTGAFESRTWTCSQTNGLGEWAIAKPVGFNGFAPTDQLTVSEWGTREFAERRLTGESQIEAVLGEWSPGETYSDIELSPLAPNLRIFVQAGVDAQNNPVPARNAWVGVDDGMEWLGGGSTNAAGFASIAIPESRLGAALNVQVNIEHNPALSENFAGVRKVFDAVVSPASPRQLDVQLGAPNFKISVSEPGDQGAPIASSWVEIMNEGTGAWLGGANTSSTGLASLKLAVQGVYSVTVNPPWEAGSEFSKNTYYVTVNSDGAVTGVSTGQAPVSAVLGVYPLTLATPNVRGVVTDSANNTVRDSWITPIGQSSREYLWWLGTNSRSGGEFGLNLENGVYLLEANPSWNNPSSDSKSMRCSVEVTNGSLNGAFAGSDKCGFADGKVQLQLRAPNVSFTLKAPGGITNVPFANVGMFLGGWSVWTQSDRNGLVSLNLDADEIKVQSGLTAANTYDIRVVVEPPFGSSDLVRLDCNSTDSKPVCANIPDFVLNAEQVASFSGALQTGFTATFEAPNTKLQISNPDGDPLLERGTWVNLFALRNGGGYDWISGGSSDALGLVAFNLDLTNPDQQYRLEINPPHNQGGDFAQATFSGLTRQQINQQSFRLTLPNLKLRVFDETGNTAARWAWVGVEEVNPSDNNAPVSWLTGAGTDRQGQVSLNLPNSKRYKIMLNPSAGTAGSFTNCLFDVNATGVVSKVAGSCDSLVSFSNGVWEIDLSAGNVLGRASYQAGEIQVNLSGVLIVAKSGDLTVTTTSKADGTYALQLESGRTWTIEAFYVPKPEDPAFVSIKLSLDNVVPDDEILSTRNSVFVRTNN